MSLVVLGIYLILPLTFSMRNLTPAATFEAPLMTVKKNAEVRRTADGRREPMKDKIGIFVSEPDGVNEPSRDIEAVGPGAI